MLYPLYSSDGINFTFPTVDGDVSFPTSIKKSFTRSSFQCCKQPIITQLMLDSNERLNRERDTASPRMYAMLRMQAAPKGAACS